MISPLLLLNLKSYGTTRYTFQLLDLAETTMSTHFHSLVETEDEKAVAG
ncbi:MAG: hypothetical protein BWX93_01471 [Bacteroidetes bacterium ADurb.Bin139]|nr:MAG: hypothetical protein BWX93_01471 [Bacteroidetes bacterium ADurb.Bin139]